MLKSGDLTRVEAQIRAAFAGVDYPGDWCLTNSREDIEPALLEAESKGKSDWRILDPSFIDQASDGFGTALSFFSDEAFHFYLSAYLVVFVLTHGLDREYGAARIEITGAEPAPKSENHLSIRLSVVSSVDAFLGSSEDDQNRILVEFLDAPFFAGTHISALLCEHDACSRLLKIDYETQILAVREW